MLESGKWFGRENGVGWGGWGLQRACIFKEEVVRSRPIEMMTFKQTYKEASQ